MKKLCLALLLVFCVAAYASADILTFQWDYTDTPVDGFYLYQALVVYDTEQDLWLGQYDFTVPVVTGEFPDGKIPAQRRELTTEVLGVENAIQKFCWVLRAYRGGQESENSNQICAKINNLPLVAPVALNGVYDRDAETIKLTWVQENNDRVQYWQVYYRLPEQDEFTLFTRVDSAGEQAASITLPFDKVALGSQADVTWTVVAFKNPRAYSPDASNVSVSVDRRDPDAPLPPPVELRFKIVSGS